MTWNSIMHLVVLSKYGNYMQQVMIYIYAHSSTLSDSWTASYLNGIVMYVGWVHKKCILQGAITETNFTCVRLVFLDSFCCTSGYKALLQGSTDYSAGFPPLVIASRKACLSPRRSRDKPYRCAIHALG